MAGSRSGRLLATLTVAGAVVRLAWDTGLLRGLDAPHSVRERPPVDEDSDPLHAYRKDTNVLTELLVLSLGPCHFEPPCLFNFTIRLELLP